MTTRRQALLLIGSPKPTRSTSGELGGYLLRRLCERGWEDRQVHIHASMRSERGRTELIEAVDAAALVILAFPLYVDSLPAPVIRALELVAQHRSEAHHGSAEPSAPPSFLAISNCGFPEAVHTEVALAICRRFAREAGFAWAGGLGLGGGGAIDGRPLDRIGRMALPLVRSLDLAADALAAGRPVPQEAIDLMARPLIPSWSYRLIGNLDWWRQAWKFRSARRLFDRPYR